MRKALYHHIVTLPLNFFRKTQPGTVVNALTTELTVPGNFVGMAVSSPVTNVLTLMAFAATGTVISLLAFALLLQAEPGVNKPLLALLWFAVFGWSLAVRGSGLV